MSIFSKWLMISTLFSDYHFAPLESALPLSAEISSFSFIFFLSQSRALRLRSESHCCLKLRTPSVAFMSIKKV
jgi:hypothetical protein